MLTAKKSKTTTFFRVFDTKNRQFSREIKVEFLDKKWRFRKVCRRDSFPFAFGYSLIKLNANIWQIEYIYATCVLTYWTYVLKLSHSKISQCHYIFITVFPWIDCIKGIWTLTWQCLRTKKRNCLSPNLNKMLSMKQ